MTHNCCLVRCRLINPLIGAQIFKAAADQAEDSADSEQSMMATLASCKFEALPRAKMPRFVKPSQAQSMHKKLTPEDIKRVCSLLDKHKDNLPPELRTQAGEFLTLRDSGSAPNVSDLENIFPEPR